MSNAYRLLGAELSPYSIKVRSYLRYKNIPHKWLLNGPANKALMKQYGKLPIVPLLITPDGQGMQDSTPIIDALEARFPEPAVLPADPALAFIAQLLEEYADEWGNKHMFHYRWAAEADQDSAALRLAEMQMPLWMRYIPIMNSIIQGKIATMIKQRMSGRAWVIGSNEQTEGAITDSFENLLSLLQRHLRGRKYILGDRPSYADFALWGQIYNAWTDPTPRKIISDHYSDLKPWLLRMLKPSAEGEFETWGDLESTLMPILQQEVGGLFLPWADAVSKALAAEEDHIDIQLNGKAYAHSVSGPQKYHAKSLLILREKYRAIEDKQQLQSIMATAGCHQWLA